MNQKELKELIEFLIEKDIAEFELERGDVKVRIKRAADVVAAPVAAEPVTHMTPAPRQAATAAAATPAPPGPAKEAPSEEGLHIVKSPIVGTFYEAPSPGAPPFVKVGDQVQAGQVLCIVEAMKLMNEIEADASGEIVKKMVQNGQPVEYAQPLFAIRTA
ncbi:MAG: acetyl-CoA carboxylase biotin carboxyl carrier protein [Acidobacteriia bacterium]|nr:acetyl-CoA carboxylase biotin carboxyl carrier protein [Terriglobia bacterium]